MEIHPLAQLLREELERLRPFISEFPADAAGEVLRKTGELFNLGGELLEGAEPASALETLLDLLLVASALLPAAEKKLPLFLTEVTVFYEPLPEKVDHLKTSILFALSQGENRAAVDFEELAYLFREIGETLGSIHEIALKISNRVC